MHLFEIWKLFSNHDNYWWNEERQGSKPDVFIMVVSDCRRHCLWLERRDLTVYKSVCLKVNRSEEVPQPHDPQVWLDISIYSLCPWQRHSWQIERENKRADCASDDDLKGICWRRIIAWLNVSSVADSVCLWCLKCLCWCVSHSVGIYFNYIASLHCWPAVESNQF